MISKEQRRFYDENGFVVLENFWSGGEIGAFQARLAGLFEKALLRRGLPVEDPLHTGCRRLDKLDHEEIRQVYNIIKRSDALAELSHSPKVFAVIRALLDMAEDEVVCNMYHLSRIDPPNDERFLYKWHQESFYTMPGSTSVQLWAPLADRSSPANGTIDALVGSHLAEVPHHIERVPGGHEQRYVEDKDCPPGLRNLVVEINPGDALFFHPYLIHRSNSNTSDRVRYSLVSHYYNPALTTYSHDAADHEAVRQYHRRRCVNFAAYEKAGQGTDVGPC